MYSPDFDPDDGPDWLGWLLMVVVLGAIVLVVYNVLHPVSP